MGGLNQNLQHVWDLLGSWANEHLLNIIIILVGAYILRRFGSGLVNGIINRTVRHDMFPTELDRQKRITTLTSLSNATVGLLVWMVAIVMLISELGVNTAPLLASAGILGVALGFGAQSLVKDFVSGIFIISENQFRVGDIVQLGEVSGVVETITIRTTILRDLDGYLHHVPNGTITVTTNKTIGYAGLNEDIVVAADTDIEQLEHLINHVGEQLAALPELAHKIKDPPRMVGIKGLHEKGITVKVIGQTTSGSRALVRSHFYRLLKKACAHAKIDAELSLHSDDL